MIRMTIGFVLGVAVATIGFQGVAKLADQEVKSAQVVLKERVSK